VVIEHHRDGPADRRKMWRGGRRDTDHLNGPIVLVVDDHADCRELIAAVLGSAGIATAEASSCATAMRRLAEVPTLSAVIADLRLPDCHGTELIRVIKAAPATAHLPVLVLSASVTAVDRQAAADAGAVAFLAKPVLPDQVLDAVRRVLSRSL
jgi:Response regulator containing CheY-like receiver, AAA-type ATPase, and DNA-binding domains